MKKSDYKQRSPKGHFNLLDTNEKLVFFEVPKKELLPESPPPKPLKSPRQRALAQFNQRTDSLWVPWSLRPESCVTCLQGLVEGGTCSNCMVTFCLHCGVAVHNSPHFCYFKRENGVLGEVLAHSRLIKGWLEMQGFRPSHVKNSNMGSDEKAERAFFCVVYHVEFLFRSVSNQTNNLQRRRSEFDINKVNPFAVSPRHARTYSREVENKTVHQILSVMDEGDYERFRASNFNIEQD